MTQDVGPQTVELRYDSTEEDLREVVRVLSRRQRGPVRLLLSPVTWAVLGLAGVWLIVAHVDDSGALFACGVFLLAEALLLPLLPRLSARQHARAMRSMLVPCQVTVDDEQGIRSVTATMTTDMAWGAFGSYIETDRLFVLRGPEPGGKRGGWLAKRGVAGPAELERLRAVLDRHLPRA